MHLKAGLLGKLFGSGTNAMTNISGIIAIILIITAAVYPFFSSTTNLIDSLKPISPIVLAILGYLFGKSNPDN